MRIGVVFLDIVISFFRDTLSGPLYIVVVVIGVIGICACIGYLAEEFMKQKDKAVKQEKMYASVPTVTVSEPQQNAVQAVPSVATSQLENVVSSEDIAKATGSTVVVPTTVNGSDANNSTAVNTVNKQ